MTSRQRDLALYHQLADFVRDRIHNGTYAVGATLPTERELCKAHGLGLMTVRRAVALLREEGLISTTRGNGSVVRTPPARTTVMIGPTSNLIARMPDATERESMGLEPGVPLIEIRHADGAVHTLPADQVTVTGQRTAEIG